MPEIIHSSQLPFETPGFTHRVNAPTFKYLFAGAHHSPNNHLCFLGRQHAFYSPIHKHNFEQIRYAHRGDFSISSTRTIRPGEVCYHPEGVLYGPQSDPDDGVERVLLLLQFGGLSRQGFLEKDLRGGKFFGKEEGEGKDGFEAVWEECNGRLLVYPEPRYEMPVLMKPQNYGWIEIGAKVFKKHLGNFTERETRVEFLRVERGGVLKMDEKKALQFGFVVEREGSLDGEKLAFEDAIRLQAGEGATLDSVSRLEMLRIVVPTLEE